MTLNQMIVIIVHEATLFVAETVAQEIPWDATDLRAKVSYLYLWCMFLCKSACGCVCKSVCGHVCVYAFASMNLLSQETVFFPPR